MREIKIAWMYPDTLYLHGERGNLLALERVARSAGLEAVIEKIDFDDEFNPMDCDVIFFPPGEITYFETVKRDLVKVRPMLIEFINSGKPMLVTGTTVGLFCREIIRNDGTRIEGLGLIDSIYRENNAVYGDDLLSTAEYNGKNLELVANQIQMGDIELNDAAPFGYLVYGYGNNGKDRNEGIRLENSIFTNSLGPLLVWNPWLTREIITTALIAGGEETPKYDFDDSLELKSLEVKKEFILKKATNLTNCK